MKPPLLPSSSALDRSIQDDEIEVLYLRLQVTPKLQLVS